MPLFRVELARRVPLVDMPRNPFAAGIDVLKPIPCRTTVRAWEFEAKSERQARQYFNEAVKLRHPNVVGFQLDRIGRVTHETPEGAEPAWVEESP